MAAYIPFDENKPAGTDTPPVYSSTDLSNVRALRDAVVSGFVPGWAFAFTTAAGPARDIYTWTKGTLRLRSTFTYTGALITALLWEYSDDSGGTWQTINTGGTAAAITSDPSGIILAGNKDVSAFLVAISALQRANVNNGSLAAHIAATGVAVHGLGTLSIQNANAVALTGGNAAGVSLTLAPRISPAAPPTLVTGQPLDFAATPLEVEIVAGGTINGFANAVAGEMRRVIVAGAGAITVNAGGGNTFTWAVGHPTYGATLTILNVIARNATTFLGTSIPF